MRGRWRWCGSWWRFPSLAGKAREQLASRIAPRAGYAGGCITAPLVPIGAAHVDRAGCRFAVNVNLPLEPAGPLELTLGHLGWLQFVDRKHPHNSCNSHCNRFCCEGVKNCVRLGPVGCQGWVARGARWSPCARPVCGAFGCLWVGLLYIVMMMNVIL